MKIATIWNSGGLILAKINASPSRPRDEIWYFLAILYGSKVDSSAYELVERAKKGKKASDPVTPKHYVLRPIEDAEPILTLFPRRASRLESAQSVTSVFALEDAQTELARADAISKLLPADIVRYAKFSLHVAMRDRACVVTGEANPSRVIGAHLIPFAWRRRGLSDLPEEVQNILASTMLGLDDVTNGLFLSSQYHDSFDNGSWSVFFRYNDGRRAVVGEEVDLAQGNWIITPITEDCPPEIVGKFLRVPEGTQKGGVEWSSLFPPSILWWFHLKASVLKHCRGYAGGPDLRRGGDKFDIKAFKVLTDEMHFIEDVDGDTYLPLYCDREFFDNMALF